MDEQWKHGREERKRKESLEIRWNFGSEVSFYAVSVTTVTRLKKQAPF